VKISQQELYQIIKEEVQAVLKEVNPVPTPTSSEEDPTKPQGRKGLEKQKVPDPKVKDKQQKIHLKKRTAAQKKKARQDIKKRAQGDGKYAKAIEAEKKRKAKKAKAEKSKKT